MNKLDELIALLCPNGVKYQELAHAVSIERGKRVVREQLDETGLYPVYQNSLTPLGYHSQWNYPAETTFLIVAGAAGEIGYSTCNFWAADDCFPLVCGENLSSRYLYHVMLWLQPTILSRVRKASIPRLSRDSIERLTIPVPPLEVQREIVRILDTFTELTAELAAELTAELTARKQQYAYYRDNLLTFRIDIIRKSLDELCIISAAGDAPKEALSLTKTAEYQIPVISNGIGENAFYGYTDKPKITEPAVTVAARGTIGYAEYRDYPYYPIIRLLSVIPKNTDVLATKYLYYCLQGKKYNVPSGGIPQLTAPELKKVVIPVPPLPVQQRIANVLDNFDAICSDLNIGLPAEIEARKKQYEYYRDKLLSFTPAD